MIDGLPIGLHYYLATPYTKYPHGIERAFRDAATVAGNLLKLGYQVYSPIVHCHPLAVFAGLDPLDHKIWLPNNARMLAICQAMIVAKLDGWNESTGVRLEIEEYRREGKRVFDLEIDKWIKIGGTV